MVSSIVQAARTPATVHFAALPLGRKVCRLRRAVPSSRCRGSPVRMLKVEKWDPSALGPLTEDAMRKKLMDEGYSVTRYVFSPGTVFDYHDHGVTKKDSILSGQFLFRMDDQDAVLKAGDMVVVPAGKTHYAEVVGSEPVIFFDASKFT